MEDSRVDGGERLHETSRRRSPAQAATGAAAHQPRALQDVEEVRVADGVDEGVQTGCSLANNACGIRQAGTWR